MKNHQISSNDGALAVYDNNQAAGVNASAAKEGGVVNNAISAVKSKIITAAKGTKVGQRIVNDYNIAKANYQNHPVSTSQDAKVIQELGEYVAGLKKLLLTRKLLTVP